MRVVAEYSFNQGKEEIQARYPHLLHEVREVIREVNADDHRLKESKEKTMMGRMLYSPPRLNKAFKTVFTRHLWRPVRVPCSYDPEWYIDGYEPDSFRGSPFREMDFVKDKLGVEVQFGKYAFMVYNVCAKMTIFKNLAHIDCGVEIVPVRTLSKNMSTGVSFFEQIAWDLKHRGISNIDIPVLILGVDR